ncbi:unnamed protein product [Caenorhabditis auriculariae]|uniref:Protein tweety homolog n=1 Tax=Caenorhabditis auriculariae TaxID=2777116 RepID=A0A8S1GQ51_9PELO|nr:unnamed protein product [Caenorhabditis auriculariae]
MLYALTMSDVFPMHGAAPCIAVRCQPAIISLLHHTFLLLSDPTENPLSFLSPSCFRLWPDNRLEAKMTVANLLLKAFSLVPHLNFQFKKTDDVFNLDWRSEYIQSLALIAALGGLISFLLLLTIVIVWVCQTCRTNVTTGKTRRKVRRLSTALFVLSVACFFMLGICLFANEHINRGVSVSIDSVVSLKRSYKLSYAQVGRMEETARNTSSPLTNLGAIVNKEGAKKGVNQTLLQESKVMLQNFTAAISRVADSGKVFLEDHEHDLERLERIRSRSASYESERWAFLVIVLSITICVLFAGVIAFCRQSKKGAVIFSAVGFFIFIIVWVLIAVIFPISIGLSDFCTNGKKFAMEQLGNLDESVEFYKTCAPRPANDILPPDVNRYLDLMKYITGSKSKLDGLLQTTFNSSEAITNATMLVGQHVSDLVKLEGAVGSASACFVFHDDIINFYYGVCDQSIVGLAVLFISTFLLGIFLFVVLIIVSKTWRLFTKMPHDYVEVDEDDIFNPHRGSDSAIPVDIYGTHVFNPRTRDRAEPSTNTTNGTTGDEQSSLLWNRGSVAHPVNRFAP